MNDFIIIKKMIEKIIQSNKKVAVFPISELGFAVVNICRELYGIEALKIDNYLCEKNNQIFPCSYLKDKKEYAVIVASRNIKIYDNLISEVKKYVESEQIYQIDIDEKYKTSVGKFSYGPICRNHPGIKSIGKFCSFAEGVDVVLNHQMDYISTHLS